MNLNSAHSDESSAMPDATIEARAHTTADGVLNLSIPVGFANTDVVVVLQVKPITAIDVDENGWPRGYFEQVVGSMPELQRPPQGEFESRLPLE